MVPDHCVLRWGQLHKSLVEECEGSYTSNMRAINFPTTMHACAHNRFYTGDLARILQRLKGAFCTARTSLHNAALS
eukprot:COSAG02_NODE_4158_length_5692_cov_2.326541_5_plen_76_part_00